MRMNIHVIYGMEFNVIEHGDLTIVLYKDACGDDAGACIYEEYISEEVPIPDVLEVIYCVENDEYCDLDCFQEVFENIQFF